MKRFLLVFVLLLTAASVPALIQASPDKISVDENGRLATNDERVLVNRQYDGKKVPLREAHLHSSAGTNPGIFLSIYWDATNPSPGTERLIIIDATGNKVRHSNVFDTGMEFEWGDNNYVTFDGSVMYFGIYSPKRMQFVYKDGKLEENKGPWRGPAKPEIYIEPTGNDPCFNVNGLEECRKEVAEEQARQARLKRKVTRHKAKAPASTPQ